MQVFIVGGPLETAMALDPKRLNRQIQETRVILAALNGAKAWSNHPCVLQYRGYEFWLLCYLHCLQSFYDYLRYDRRGDKYDMQVYDNTCFLCRPDWHTQEYYDQMKRRLYTKDPKHYKQWADLGESGCNWYFVDGEAKEIFKDPKTDSGMKKSLKGLISVVEKDGKYVALDCVEPCEEASGCLETVFENGKIIREFTLSEIRENINTTL